MGSLEGNQINDGTGFQPSSPPLCANGCGFFGSAATMGLCSKCYRDSRIEEERAASAKAVFEKFVRSKSGKDDSSGELIGPSYAKADEKAAEPEKKAAVKNRCSSCNKKVGLMGYQCRCGGTFCGTHRYAEQHSCTFDFKGQGKVSIAKANPVIKADKIDRI